MSDTDITHSFSRAQAKLYGVHGAILLRYLIDKFMEDTYDQHIYKPELEDSAHYREIFLSHSLCFLNMAFHCLKFEQYRIYLGKPYGRISQVLYNRLSPWIEQHQANNRAKTIQDRTAKFASPDADKEADPNLSAAEKMQVLRQSLQARNRIGNTSFPQVLRKMCWVGASALPQGREEK